MPLINFTPTTSQVEGVTRKQILDRFLRETGLGQYGTITGTGSTTTINDTARLLSSQFSTSDWVGGWARISKDAGGAGAAPENEHSPITTYDPVTNGRITFAPAMTAAPTTSDEYQLWKFPNPTIVKDFLDQILQNDIYLPCWAILSGVPDYDMEAANTTDWTGSSATVTKVTGTEPVMSSKRWLQVVATAANGYARTATFTVEPGSTLRMSALVHVIGTSTTAKLQAYDITNSTEIDYVESDKLYAVRLMKDINIPSTCKQMQLRLITEEDTKTTQWDEVFIYSLADNEQPLPWWVKNKNQIKGIFELRANQIDSNIYDTTLFGNIVNNRFSIRDNAFGRGQLVLYDNEGKGFNNPIFIFGIRNETAYTDDISTVKRIDDNLIFYCLAYKVFEHLSKLPTTGILDSTWIQQQYQLYEKKYIQVMRQQKERLEEVIQATISNGYFLDRRFSYGYN